jgi:Endonuclease/Exonuclease/phosphatase family
LILAESIKSVVGSPVLNVIPYTDSGASKSRAILQATVNINNKNVTFLSAHFPSQSNPTQWRKEAMEHMKKLMLDLQSKKQAVIAGGDLNTTSREESDYGYFRQILSPVGDVSHLVGCRACLGTHSYRGQWSFLDVLVFGKNLSQDAKLELIPDSLQVVRTPVNSKPNGTPLRFDETKKEGVSDHFPLYSRLKIIK